MPHAATLFYYDESGYVETQQRPAQPRPGEPLGLMGRQVAGKAFLDAYLRHGTADTLRGLTTNSVAARALQHTVRQQATHLGREWAVETFVQSEWFESLSAGEHAGDAVYFPCPPDARFAWAREHRQPHAFALCGVTHTLCSAGAIESLRNLLIAPFHAYDRLICTSRSVVDMVQATVAALADDLARRFGGRPRLEVPCELIPLGVDAQRYRPPAPEQRAAQRRQLGIADDEIAVLFVGRLSHHAKAHPFPMFRSVAAAARQTGQKVHLLLAGWAASPVIRQAFESGAALFAPGVRCTLVDGTSPQHRFSVWHAADVFTSLSDNIQETFGLVILEAMACGLPVVATDWNGYRDLVSAARTGYLVPTLMVRDATRDATLRLLLGEVNYDHFLAECNQTVTVDCHVATQAFVALFSDTTQRQQLGRAGREQVERRFDWRHIVAAYEQLWAQQAEELEHARLGPAVPAGPTPTAYPPPEVLFAGYPTRWLGDDCRVQAAEDALERLADICRTPLTNYEAERRLGEPLARELLAAARQGCSLAALDNLASLHGATRVRGRATIAWLLKYDLLRGIT